MPKPVWPVSQTGLTGLALWVVVKSFWARKSLSCHGCSCSKEERFLRQVFSRKGFWGVSGQNWPNRFAKPVWPVSPACVRLSPTEAVWPVSETGLTSLDCQQPCRVCFRYVSLVDVGWVLLLGPVALQWLRGLGKKSLWRCTSEIGFIGRILEYNFYRLPFTPLLSLGHFVDVLGALPRRWAPPIWSCCALAVP
jgi:hypothetical protein